MESKITVYGIDIQVEVPNKPEKRKYRKRGARAKAPLRPKRDKMMRSPNDGGNTVTK